MCNFDENDKKDILCFVIDGKNIVLEKVLVEFHNIPIFFICNDSVDKYLVLCTEIIDSNVENSSEFSDNFAYMVMKISLIDLHDLLYGNYTMRDIILKQNEYWYVVTGDSLYDDTITKESMNNVELEYLPIEGAYFDIITDEIKEYVKNF